MDKRGFTLLEVVIALAILGIALLGAQTAVTGKFIREVGGNDAKALATQLVEDRIEVIRMSGYGALNDFREPRGELKDYPGYFRTTQVRAFTSTAAGPASFTRITVMVDGAFLTEPVSRTISRGAE